MSSRRCVLATAGAMIAAFFIAFPAHAQVARSGGAPNAELQQQLQQLASERTGLLADNARLKQQLEAVSKERDSLKSARQALDQRARSSAAALAQSSAQHEQLEQDLARNREQTQQLIDKFRETVQTMRGIETDRNDSRQKLAGRESELKVCIDRNLSLYKLNDEVLTHFDRESFWSRLGTAEPFTRIKRVQIENLIDDYRSRAEDQRATTESLKATPGAAAASAPPPPGPQPKLP